LLTLSDEQVQDLYENKYFELANNEYKSVLFKQIVSNVEFRRNFPTYKQVFFEKVIKVCATEGFKQKCHFVYIYIAIPLGITVLGGYLTYKITTNKELTGYEILKIKNEILNNDKITDKTIEAQDTNIMLNKKRIEEKNNIIKVQNQKIQQNNEIQEIEKEKKYIEKEKIYIEKETAHVILETNRKLYEKEEQGLKTQKSIEMAQNIDIFYKVQNEMNNKR
jgi:hypothetical protein